MEAMSIESLLLSSWEEDGFVGKTRVPVGASDVDVLAIHATERKVRVGESKVRGTSQALYVIDESSLSHIESHADQDFTAWLEDSWSNWLTNLPNLWDEAGRPLVPWLLAVSDVDQIQVVFCCNLVVYCDRTEANRTLARAVERSLRKNPALVGRASAPDFIDARIVPTIETVTGLIRAISTKIDMGYGRRFGDQFKDLFREIHRYLRPELQRLPYDRKRQKMAARKSSYHARIRKETVLNLISSMGVTEAELRQWMSGNEDSPSDKR